MPYVKRDESNKVEGLYRRQQEFATEFLSEDNPEVVAFRNPPPPSASERIDAAFPQTDVARVIFEALYELANDVRTLKGQGTITRSQLRDWLKAKLP